MVPGQGPPNPQRHNTADFRASGLSAIDMDQFMLENHQNSSLGPSHMDPVGNSQFAGFSFFPGQRESGMQREPKLEDLSEQYNMLDQPSASDHRSSIVSLQQGHRPSISSVPGDPRGGPLGIVPALPQANFVGGNTGNGSSGGSEEASPSSNRAHVGLDGRYADDFGLGTGEAVDGSDLGTRTREDKNDPNPPWSELKTKAGKERKRLPLACIACRRKKIRCSGEKPACKHCVRSRSPCVYKVTTRKAAPRTDYMAMLDKRLKRMEERIIKIVPKDEQDVNASNVTRAIVKPAIPGTIPIRNSGNKKRPADEAFGTELDAWSKTATNPNLEGKPNTLKIQEAEDNKLLTEGLEALPPREIQEHLSEVFFENVYGQTYHLLHKPSFMRKLRAGSVPPVLILAVCAVSARFSTHPKLNSNPAFLRGEEWAAEVRKIVLRRHEWPNITILTCLLLLGLNEFGTCQGGRSWSFGGMAIRMAYALQLHKDLEYDPAKKSGPNKSSVALSFVDREIRRRTMWSCFLMDRFNSSGTERPTFILESSIKVQLPIKEMYFQMDMPGPTEDLKGDVPSPISPGAGQLSDPKENMGVAAYMIRAIALWGRIINYLNLGGSDEDPHPLWHPESRYANLLEQTETFESTLPDALQYNQENLHTHETESSANQFLFLHIVIWQNKLFINRFPMQAQNGEPPPEFTTKASAVAVEAANRISELLRDAESHYVTAPFTGYCAFLSGTLQLQGVFSRNPEIQTKSKEYLAVNVRYLSRMKRYWGVFHSMAESLKQLYQAFAARGSGPPSKIIQYGDWFDTYPNGVSRSDYEDPAAEVKQEKGSDAVLGDQPTYHTAEQFFNELDPSQSPSQEGGRPSKRKAKKSLNIQSNQPEPVNANIPNMAQGQGIPMQVHHGNNPQLNQGYNQISPASQVEMYHPQQAYYGNNLAVPPNIQGILPQLDRQLVFGAYAGMDEAYAANQNLLDAASQWEMPNNGINGFATEPSSAWFMPFNMDPPDLAHEQDFFNTMGGNGAGYAMGGSGMHVNNGHLGNHGNTG